MLQKVPFIGTSEGIFVLLQRRGSTPGRRTYHCNLLLENFRHGICMILFCLRTSSMGFAQELQSHREQPLPLQLIFAHVRWVERVSSFCPHNLKQDRLVWCTLKCQRLDGPEETKI